ncbi:patatin-like phospholipase family protein [Phaeospirillum tilakii]|uniref:Patatin-like phospholipase family protein n=1 Tax=Phaeospirillum tilakii TaxID=741673 RepID=A0ABW5CEA6_9PROT
MKTFYFSNCMAAFEGGGVRGAAYAGAYEAAIEAGVCFSRVAGSSAGSVVAAFVAAGASPASIKRRMLETEFAAFKAPARVEAAPFKKSGLPKFAGFARMFSGKWMNAIEAGGMFSTSALHAWVENNLRGVFAEQGRPVPDRPIHFKDLPLPLHIVAADVSQKEPKVWSRETTPDESVALAVQASCAIPVYFQPVTSGTSVLVDGGAVSNLPTHVFPANRGHPGRFSDKTLAFRLRSATSPRASQFEDARAYALGMADTMVTSATHIQQSLQDGVYSVEIETGDILATDFDRMTREVQENLYDNGFQAMRTFVAREREFVGRHRVASQFDGFDERLLGYVHCFIEARSTIWISDSSTYWLWFIFPALASAIRRGVKVRMVAGPVSLNAREEERRRNLLRAMGCDVQERSISFTGILVDFPSDAATAVVSSERGAVGNDFHYDAEKIKIYTSDDDLPVINSLGVSFVEQFDETRSALPEAAAISIEPMCSDELFAALKTVRHYEQARFDIQELALDTSLRVCQTRVKEFKLLQVAKLVEELSSTGLELFAPCRYRLPDRSTSIITPPVVEITPQGPVMIEGHTRAFYAARQGRSHLKVVMVDRVRAALPVEPRPFHDLTIAQETIEVSTNMPGFQKALMRNIEEALHAESVRLLCKGTPP